MPNTGILFAGIEAIRKGPMKDEYQTAGELKYMVVDKLKSILVMSLEGLYRSFTTMQYVW